MKILTNEYSCNTPNFNKPAKGGPANFARIFFTFLKQKSTTNQWQGIIINFDDRVKKISLKKIVDSHANRSIYKLVIPSKLSNKITKAKKATIDPSQIMAEPITVLSKLIKKESPDIVFLNGFSLSNWILLKASHQARRPIAIQHAGIWNIELEIYKNFFSASGLKIMKKMETDSSTLSNAEIFLNKFSQKKFKNIVLKEKSFAKKLIKIIPLPVDFSFFKSPILKKSSFNFDNNNFNLGVVSRWDRIKNHEAIANLAVLIKKQKLPWIIHSVVEIPDNKNKASLKNKYRKNINIIKHLSKEAIRDFCQASDLIIIPSKFDVSPTILLEALACNTATAISANVGFVNDYLQNEAKNWIIDFDNPLKAIKQIKKIQKKPIPKKLKKSLINKHQSGKVFEQYFSLFNDLVKKYENNSTSI